MRNIYKKLSKIAIASLVFAQALPALAATYSSTTYQVVDPEFNQSGGRSTSTTYVLIGTAGETAVGRATSTTFISTAGSLAYPRCTSPTLTATAGASGVVNLSWTSATCEGGWTLSSYQYCQGTTADTYSSCTSAGTNITASATATSGVLTFFRIRVIATGAASSGSPAGNVGSRSSEISITPAGGGGAGGGGGGGGGGVASVTTLSLTSPNGGETLTQGSTHNTTWTSTGNSISSIALFLSADAGLSFSTTIATGEANDGSYSWTVPNLTGSRFRVRAEGRTSTGTVLISDISNANFSIGPAGAVPEPEPEAPTTAPTQPAKSADLNADNKINLTDFSTILAWYKKAGAPSEMDLNRDGIVNLRDISILLFQWTG